MTAPSQRLAWTTAVRDEIDDLHLFFQEWFLGERPDSDEVFSRLERALADTFAIVTPEGQVMEREALLSWLRGAHGKRSGEPFRIWVRSVQLRDDTEARLLVSYEEWQETDDGVTARLSSGWFAVEPGGEVSRDRLRWLHVHEAWLPGRSPDDVASE